jgi:hypothetical protein
MDGKTGFTGCGDMTTGEYYLRHLLASGLIPSQVEVILLQ